MENKFTDIKNIQKNIENNEIKNKKLETIKNNSNFKIANTIIDKLINTNNDIVLKNKQELSNIYKSIDEYSIFEYHQLDKYAKLFKVEIDIRKIFPIKAVINGNEFAHVYSYDLDNDNVLFNGDINSLNDDYIGFINFVITCKINADKIILTNDELWVLYTRFYNYIHTDSLYLDQKDKKYMVRRRTEK